MYSFNLLPTYENLCQLNPWMLDSSVYLNILCVITTHLCVRVCALVFTFYHAHVRMHSACTHYMLHVHVHAFVHAVHLALLSCYAECILFLNSCVNLWVSPPTLKCMGILLILPMWQSPIQISWAIAIVATSIICNSCKTLIGVHEMHGQIHPN